MHHLPVILIYIGLAGSGLIAGVFFAFSSFIMRALAAVPNSMAAMQSINLVVINPIFLGVFMGTAGIALASVIGSFFWWQKAGAAWLLAAGLLYFVGTFGATVIGNVPLNDSLAKVEATDPDTAVRWEDYVTRWTRWNHLRTVAATAAMVSYAVALRRWE